MVGRKVWLFSFLFSCLILCLVAQTPAKRQLRVGAFSNFPLAFTDSQGVARGIYPDLIGEIAAINGWELKFEVKELDTVFNEIRAGEIDLIAAVASSSERSVFLNFSKENTLTMWGQIFLPINSEVQTIFDLKGKRIGVLESGVNRINLQDRLDEFQIQADLIFFKTYEEMVAAIQNAQIEAGVISNIHADYLMNKYNIRSSSVVFTPFSLFFASGSHVEPEILQIIDQQVATWKKNHDSFYYKTLRKWHSAMGQTAPHDYTGIYRLFVLLFVVISLLFVMIKALRAQIKLRTSELENSNHQLSQEIAHKNEIEKELKFQKEQYRVLTESSNDIILRFARDYTHLFANQVAIAISGKSFAEHIGITCRDIGFSKYISNLMEQGIEEVFKTGRPDKFDFEFQENGKTIFLEMNLSPEFDEAGKIVSVVGVGRDVTSRKAAEQENLELEKKLQHAMRLEAIGTLAGGIAHDFNNILTPILGYSELIAADMDEENPDYEAICEITRAAQRGKELAGQILVFSRQPESRLKPLTLENVLNEVLKLIRATLPTTIDIIRDFGSDCPKIAADSAQIHQLLVNLFTNAFYAMKDEGGVLLIKLSRFECQKPDPVFRLLPGIYAHLLISDTGIGMSQEIAERIFEPYFSTKPREKGSGLGLFMVHSIVSKLGGRITVDSEPGRGTDFHLFFPASTAIVDDEKQKIQASLIESDGNETILVVDDEEMIVRLSQRLLTRIGYKVVGHTSSDAALHWFKENPDQADLLLTDMTMPGLTGADLASAVLQIRPELPVIVCTGFSEAISPQLAEKIGIKEILIKPLTLRELAESIKKALPAGKNS